MGLQLKDNSSVHFNAWIRSRIEQDDDLINPFIGDIAMAKNSTKNDQTSREAQHSRQVAARYPFGSVEQLFDDFFSNRWMQPFRGDWPSIPEITKFGGNLPKVDMIDRDNEVFIRADVPGIEKDDLEVTLTDSSVTILAHGQQKKEDKDGEYYCHEIYRGEFSRTLNLPAEVNGDKAQAVFKNGVLSLTLPKVEQSKRHTVKVQ